MLGPALGEVGSHLDMRGEVGKYYHDDVMSQTHVPLSASDSGRSLRWMVSWTAWDIDRRVIMQETERKM
jgi:hypothetical protein